MADRKARNLSLYFVRCDTTSLQQVLEGIGDFAGIPSHKIVTGLQVFQTPAMLKGHKENDLFILDNLTYSDFEEIPENCNKGCGFIPKEVITRLLSSHARGKQIVAMEVRLFAPKTWNIQRNVGAETWDLQNSAATVNEESWAFSIHYSLGINCVASNKYLP